MYLGIYRGRWSSFKGSRAVTTYAPSSEGHDSSLRARESREARAPLWRVLRSHKRSKQPRCFLNPWVVKIEDRKKSQSRSRARSASLALAPLRPSPSRCARDIGENVTCEQVGPDDDERG